MKEFVAATIHKQKVLSKKRMEQSFKLFDLVRDWLAGMVRTGTD